MCSTDQSHHWYGGGKNEVGSSNQPLAAQVCPPLQLGYYYQNKGECDLNQSNVDSFVERVAKNNSKNNGDRYKTYYIFTD